MVTLKNIQRTDEYIQADFYPEGGSHKGFMKIAIPSLEVIEFEPAEYDVMSPAHVRRQLRRYASIPNLPTEKRLLWY